MTKRGILFVSIAIVVGLACIPTINSRVLVKGVDTYDTHRLVFGSRIFSQEITSKDSILGIGILIVDIRGSNNLTPVTVTVKDSQGVALASGSIDPTHIIDDTFATVRFDTPVKLPGDKATIEVQAPQATLDNPIGWRFDPEDYNLPRYENGILQTGSFAIQTIERVPAWKKIVSLAASNEEKSFRVAALIAGIISFTLLATHLSNPENNKTITRAQFAVIIIIALASFGTRLYVESSMHGVSGGDPYNYLLIAESLTKGENPFVSAKRLPGYPLLLTPAVIWPSIDAHFYMRTVSAIAASISVFVVFLLARQLRLAWPAQLFAASSLAWQADFFATSLRPEPYSLFGLLLLASLLLFFTAKTRRQWLLFGIVLGYAAMVRQEGFVLAAILGAAAIIREVYVLKTTGASPAYKKVAWMFLPALVFVLRFFISNTIQFGNPIYTPYFEGERLQIVDSFHAFKDASISTWSIITSMWKPSWVQQELLMPYDYGVIPVAFLVVIAWWVAIIHKKVHLTYPPVLWGLAVLSAAACVWAGWILFTDTAAAAALAPMIIAGILLVIPALFLAKTGWAGVLVSLVLLSQLLIATWFHPFAKHYQQSYPLIALMFAAALFHIQLPKKRTFLAYSLFPIWLIPFGLALVLLYSKIVVFSDSHNASAALDSVLYRSARVAHTLPGPYHYNMENLPAQFYHGLGQLRPGDVSTSIPEGVRTIVVTEQHGKLPEMPSTWNMVAQFKAEGKNEVLYIGQVWTY